MTAGYPVQLNDVNTRAGQLVTALRDTFDDIHRFASFVAAKPDSFFTNMGMSTDDLATLRAGLIDLDALYQVAHAQRQQVGNNDFFFNAQNLVGVL